MDWLEDLNRKNLKNSADMETTVNFSVLTSDEAMSLNGGGFAYDVGCIIGFVIRHAQGAAGQAEAYAIWTLQHPK